jgi:hypothetical protein
MATTAPSPEKCDVCGGRIYYKPAENPHPDKAEVDGRLITMDQPTRYVLDRESHVCRPQPETPA